MAELGIIALMLFCTAIVGTLAQRFQIPAVIGQIVVGIILGPALLNIVHPNEILSFLAEIGVIILMFMAGLESDLQLLKRYLRPSLSVAVCGVIVPMVVFVVAGKVANLTTEHAVFWGITFAATSVSITVEVLQEMKRLNGKEGTTILGAAVVDDILAVLILSVFVTLTHDGGSGNQLPLQWSLLIQLVYFVAVYLFVKWVAPWVMRLGNRMLVNSAPTILSIVVCLTMAYVADLVGLSAVVGAFFAGIAVGQTSVRQEIENTVTPIGYAFFIPIFFVSIGLEMKFDGVLDQWVLILVLTILAVVTKLYGGAIGAKLTGFSWSSGLAVGAGMISRGEMALIIAQIGLSANILSGGQYSDLVIVIVLSTLIAPLMLKYYFRRVF
ncbi:cation:proton antiporter [Paucilactobacillus suebicus]|uniref:Sodium hydrogen exchanger n=1 Tax=Paucilactobacillus suebicus DSM 5007 = KCTC 3549 TaxID=1423807 RepID=A0A0R1W5J8_9LACO|nr:cation:proton antiporter [Paucilactobacillus suebicus]KRM13038.1 sodium hydrogen exchanger [Paucilactobacillus suebicus DSM 5007 = KCTC 3549]